MNIETILVNLEEDSLKTVKNSTFRCVEVSNILELNIILEITYAVRRIEM